MDFDKELEAFRKKVLHLDESSVNETHLPIEENTGTITPQVGDILLYKSMENDVLINVCFYNETFWLTQKAMAELFDCSSNNIASHLKNIYAEKELDEIPTTQFFWVVQKEGNRNVNRSIKHYSLDAIISVGYRVNSLKATRFRQWATKTLRDFIVKGFVINDEMLKNGKAFGKDYFDELLEKIKEIRASERRFYQKITDIYSQCSYDYDKNNELTRTFFKTVQNKLLFAVTKQTAPEIIHSRIDSSKDHLGLQSWKNSPNGKILKSDITIAKNYLDQKEISSLNDIVTMYLDYAENQAKRGKLMSMQDWIDRLDAFLNFNEYEILHNSGHISRELANTLATKEYEIFRVKQDAEYVSDFDEETKKYHL